MYMFPAQSGNLRNREIALRILWINPEIAFQSRDCATIVRNLQIAQITHALDTEDGYVTAQQRDERQGNGDRETTFVSPSEQFSYLACHPAMNEIVGGQHGSTALRHFVWSNFPRARREAHDTQESVYLEAWINKLYSYKICTTTPYCSALNVSKTSIAHQHTALLFQTQYGGRRRLSSLSSILRVTHPQQIAHFQAYWQSGNS